LAAAACGGSGGGDGGGGPAAPAPLTVTVSGIVSFDFVPVVAGIGLDYAGTAARPARGVTVELLSGASVLASTTTDAAGRYSFDVAANTTVALRARAEVVRTGVPAWDVRVVDNALGDAMFALSGEPFDTGSASSTRNLHAASGWSGSAYTATRSAAPFAILDVIYDGMQLVAGASPSVVFPPLVVHWSPSNVPAFGASGGPSPATGEIGSSFYAPGEGIFLLGAADDDTDEYDRHVIAHEWGHYVEDVFSRADNFGGPHTLSDQLDMRVAFGEGFGNAFSAMVTGEPVYRDAAGPRQSLGFAFDIEGPARPGRPNETPGWFNEQSVHELLYDMFDPANADATNGTLVLDHLHLGFAPLFDALTGAHGATPALTTMFSFVNALKRARPADAPLLDALAGAQRIAPVEDDYGSGEDNFGFPETEDLQSVYDTAIVGGAAVNVCSLDDFTSAITGSTNKLGSRRFVRFAVTTPGIHAFDVRAVAPLNGAADPDLVLHGGGVVATSDAAPSAECGVDAPQECRESFTQLLAAGEYVLEVYEWTNTNDHDDDYPPLGRTCFDVTVSRP
jgi:hypothetical protein